MDKKIFEVAIITMSDKGSRGEREDKSSLAIEELLDPHLFHVHYKALIPDDLDLIKEKLCLCADTMPISLILTTGGTGFSLRDVTPEATKAVIEREVPGIAEAMRAESMRITPRGMLSRAVCGIRGHCLIVNLPGSAKAVRECLNVILEPLHHGLEILIGSATECGN